jgi:hypothetical protein
MSRKKLDYRACEHPAGLYAPCGRAVEQLPCTDEFDHLCAEFYRATGLYPSRHEFSRALSAARKARKMNRKGLPMSRNNSEMN